jgi:hypothetical protein
MRANYKQRQSNKVYVRHLIISEEDQQEFDLKQSEMICECGLKHPLVAEFEKCGRCWDKIIGPI